MAASVKGLAEGQHLLKYVFFTEIRVKVLSTQRLFPGTLLQLGVPRVEQKNGRPSVGRGRKWIIVVRRHFRTARSMPRAGRGVRAAELAERVRPKLVRQPARRHSPRRRRCSRLCFD